MKNLKTYLLILLAGLLIFACEEDEPIASCSDGIQNGNEQGIDCGGDCNECDFIKNNIPGLYLCTVYDVNGLSVFDVGGLEVIFFKFESNNLFEAFSRSVCGVNSLSTGTYSTNEIDETVTIVTGTNVTVYSVAFLGENASIIELMSADDFYIRAQKIQDNLCQGIDCNYGNCIYGYCD